MTDYGDIVVTVDGPVALIELNTPERLNPIDPRTNEADLSRALDDLRASLEVRAAVLTGRGRAFSAGAQLGTPLPHRDPRDEHRTQGQRLAWGFSFGDFWTTIEAFPKPLIAAVNGYALGGGWKLAFVCNMIIAGESTVFG